MARWIDGTEYEPPHFNKSTTIREVFDTMSVRDDPVAMLEYFYEGQLSKAYFSQLQGTVMLLQVGDNMTMVRRHGHDEWWTVGSESVWVECLGQLID